MEFRRTMGYPPAAALVNVVLRARDATKASARRADALAARAARASRRPLPRARPRAARRWRGCARSTAFQVLLKGDRASMREAVRRALVERYGERALARGRGGRRPASA